MKRCEVIKRLMLVVLLSLTQAFALTLPQERPAAAADKPTADEEKEARAVAVAFTEMLVKTNDLEPLVREMYVADFFPRYLKHHGEWMKRAQASEFMIEGVPAINFKSKMLGHARSEYWPRLYAAANTFMHVGFVSVMARNKLSDELKFDLNEMYPPEVFRLFKKNPTLANFMEKSGDYVAVETEEQLRDVTTTMEQAARLAHEHVTRQIANDRKTLDANLKLLSTALSSSKVSVRTDLAEDYGYPKGTRIFRVQPPIWYELLLVREGGRMKILWANVVHD